MSAPVDDLPLVGAITLIRTLPCLAEPGKIIVIGEPNATIDAALPLLNAILPNVISYYPLAGVMTLRRGFSLTGKRSLPTALAIP